MDSFFTRKEKVNPISFSISHRIRDNGQEDKIIPIHGDAMDMPFAKDYFDTVVSVDAYHYFGCKKKINQKNEPLLFSAC